MYVCMYDMYDIVCMYVCMVRRSHEIYAHAAWLYGHKRKILYCAFSCLHAWAMGHSN
jgi:hypothetical protein